MRRYSYSALHKLPMERRQHVNAANRAESYASSDLAYTIAFHIAGALAFLRWSMRDATLSHGIGIEGRARIDADHAIAICYMSREGRRIAGTEWAWADTMERAMRHYAEDAAKAA